MKDHKPIIIELPCFILIAGKKHAINKNREKSWHWTKYNTIKKKFLDIVSERVPKGTKVQSYPIKCRYTYYHGSKHKADLDNCITVVRKFAQDALKELGVIEDDNWEYINLIVDEFGGYAKEAYCILTIESLY